MNQKQETSQSKVTIIVFDDKQKAEVNKLAEQYRAIIEPVLPREAPPRVSPKKALANREHGGVKVLVR